MSGQIDTLEGSVILLVEDDEFIKNAYDHVLKEMNVKLVCASDGAEAFEKVRQEKYALIILDLILPKMDGFVFLEKIKAEDDLKDIPVLVLSNLGSKADIKRAMDLGADDYFVKANHTLKEVAYKIQRYLPGGESENNE
ncbi:response regulator [Patescibacteria group bacterium]|nr:response regulator [Patescibacteria group bacterium]